MVHKLLGLSAVLLLILGLLGMPALCARPTPRLHHFHHFHHFQHTHYDLHQLHSSKTDTDPNNVINIQMVAGKESEPNTFVRAPGRRASTNKIEVPTHVADESNMNIGVPVVGTLDSALVSKPKTSGCVSGPNPIISYKRSLLDPSSNSDDALQGGEDLSLFLASLTTQKDHNLFSMLPRAHRVPPSGPSKSHNSELTDKPS